MVGVKIERRENGKDECLVGKGRKEKMVDLIVLSEPTKFQPPFWRENRRVERELMIITILPPFLRDGNFTPPLPTLARADFPHPAKMVG